MRFLVFLVGMAFLLFLTLTGCSVEVSSTPVTDKPEFPELIKTYDDEYGVVCYKQRYNSNSISCVKITDTSCKLPR